MRACGDLRDELEVIASQELGDVLDAWGAWTPAQLEQLQAYLRAELAAYGMLSPEKAREAGVGLAVERRQARYILTLEACRGCGKAFTAGYDGDFCLACAAENAGEGTS